MATHSSIKNFFFFLIYGRLGLRCRLGLSCSSACGISVPGPGIEPVSPELAGGFFNHWITREVPAPVFLPGKSHGQRSLVGYSFMGLQSWIRLSTHNQQLNWGSLVTPQPPDLLQEIKAWKDVFFRNQCITII